MTISDLAQLRQLQDENAKLKRMYANGCWPGGNGSAAARPARPG